MEESGNDKCVLDLFTKDSHHHGITALYLTQDLFPPGKFAKTITRNAPYVTRQVYLIYCCMCTLKNGAECFDYF